MIVASVRGRAALVTPAGAVDVERASDGRFGPAIQDLYPAWDDFLAWSEAARQTEAEPFLVGTSMRPRPCPRQVFAIGLNYAAHAEEAGRGQAERPPTFTKFPTCIAGPSGTASLQSAQVDWEVELVVVIGRRCEHVAATDGRAHVAGVTVGQDISARDVQYDGPVP